ncbi:hypothetical protein H4R35_003531 [Dimargaris xerosporica]|nr:hypothetical protein H4R35_003531 [Dimargaris xerosporica]
MLREDSYIVIDLGSFETRCGIGVNDPNKLPTQVVPTLVATKIDASSPAVSNGTNGTVAVSPKYVCGVAARRRQGQEGVGPAHCPLSEGFVTNWDNMTAFWGYLLTKGLKLSLETMECPVLLTTPCQWSRDELERTTQVFFERFNVPGLYIVEQPLLALYGCGMLTGLVIDIDIVPVVDSAIQHHALHRLPIGGADIEARLLHLLRQDAGLVAQLGESLDEEFSRYVKERHLKVTLPGSHATDEPAHPSTEPLTFDYKGQKVTIRANLSPCVDVLFEPSLAGKVCLDVASAVEKSILACDSDKRTALWDGLILTGGIAQIQGLQSELDRQLARVLTCSENFSETQVREAKFHKIPEYFTGYKDRSDLMTFLGGTMMAKLVFADPKNYINKVDYNEMGPIAITTKSC